MNLQTRLFLQARKPEANHIASILDPHMEEAGVTTVLFERDDSPGDWCYSLYIAQDAVEHTEQWVRDLLGSDAFGLELRREELDDIDWVTQSLQALAPVTAGRFFVHGSHDRDAARKSRIAIEIDAGQAFGTGHHGTTAGCLDMLELCLRQSQPGFAMDIGCGSGVLAIALAKAARIPVLATDIDPVAVRVANENCRLNGVANFVTCATAAGFQSPVFRQFAQADLLFANILARPLEALACPMQPHIASGAKIILSGLLPHQKARLVSAYRRQGLVLIKSHIRDGWLTLLMQKP
ncbi:MAG: 50S ribosomal protein L11 methyltransferase [Pseudomonadota bacterium]